MREQVSQVNDEMLVLLNRRATLVQQIREYKERNDLDLFCPSREKEMLDRLVAENTGPFPDETIRDLFRSIFRASVGLMEAARNMTLKASIKSGLPRVVVRVGDHCIGNGSPVVIAGPCAVEDRAQIDRVAAHLASHGLHFLRAGAFKPRSSPYAFQGLGEQGLQLLSSAAKCHGLLSVTEVVDTRSVELVAHYADVIQIGTRNMFNYELLKAVSHTRKPIILKRGFAATLDELFQAAEYIFLGGNDQVILCERGIRTFSHDTRFTLDIMAVPLLKQLSRLPVVVDVSHSAGRRDIIPPLTRAALAAGADGVMIEVHPEPLVARSDADQQLDLEQFSALLRDIAPMMGRTGDQSVHP